MFFVAGFPTEKAGGGDISDKIFPSIEGVLLDRDPSMLKLEYKNHPTILSSELCGILMNKPSSLVMRGYIQVPQNNFKTHSSEEIKISISIGIMKIKA